MKLRHFFVLTIIICLILTAIWQIVDEPRTTDIAPESGQDKTTQEESVVSTAETEILINKREELIADCSTLAASCFYEEALQAIEEALQSEPRLNNDELATLINEINTAKLNLEPYNDNIYHIFFHSLIINTDLAFDGDSDSAGYDEYMITANEFKAILPQLYERNFMLVDLADTLTTNDDGTIEINPIILPPGKKPLIISVDDVSYYEYMKGDGFADHLIVDDTGKVATVVIENGTEKITYDGDVMPILDSFVDEHPDFSYRGAKGTIALTGYQGVFGYRITDLEGDELTIAINQATAVANALKANGWSFANHSYTHNQYFKKKTVTMKQLEYDTQRWKKYIEPVLGKTNIFISPFGVSFSADDTRYKYLVEQGFNIYCNINTSLANSVYKTSVIQPRVAIDGYMLRHKTQFLQEHFFDPATVIDDRRPQ